jgi:hypothetical protein
MLPRRGLNFVWFVVLQIRCAYGAGFAPELLLVKSICEEQSRSMNPKTFIFAVTLTMVLGCANKQHISPQAGDVQMAVWDSGAKEVDVLVLQLVSERPAPFPSGYYLPAIDMAPQPFITLQVSNAMAKLTKMGPRIFPALVKHLRDDRYSYSDISAAWDNNTVGDAVTDILSDEHYMFGGYKAREVPTGYSGKYGGRDLSFNDYLDDRGAELWAEWAKSKSRLEIQMDFIDWCIAKENERGFVDEAQKKKILGIYEANRQRVKKEYSEQR